jgi:hypothetical protein
MSVRRPGELLHIDSKKLGRIEGIAHRVTGRRRGVVNRHQGIGSEALHVCIDDATRLAYSDILADEGKAARWAFSSAPLVGLRGSERYRRAGHDRQRFGLSQQGFPRSGRHDRCQTQTHQTVHAANHDRSGEPGKDRRRHRR